MRYRQIQSTSISHFSELCPEPEKLFLISCAMLKASKSAALRKVCGQQSGLDSCALGPWLSHLASITTGTGAR